MRQGEAFVQRCQGLLKSHEQSCISQDHLFMSDAPLLNPGGKFKFEQTYEVA